jgi:hypothetical protein
MSKDYAARVELVRRVARRLQLELEGDEGFAADEIVRLAAKCAGFASVSEYHRVCYVLKNMSPEDAAVLDSGAITISEAVNRVAAWRRSSIGG